MKKKEKSDIRLSIVMVDGSFREKFESIDYFCKQTVPLCAYEIIWVEYYNKISPALKKMAYMYSNLKIIALGRVGKYHASYCFNAGISESKADLLVIPDADVIVEKNFLQTLIEDHSMNGDMAIYNFRYNEPKEMHNEYINIEHLKKVCILTNPHNHGGCLSLPKRLIIDINGYEQHSFFASNYPVNDWDIYTRLKNSGVKIKWHPDQILYHPWHPFTALDQSSYEIQRIIIEYREKNRITRPFSGLNGGQGVSIPPDLAMQIQAHLAKSNSKLYKAYRGYNITKNRIRNNVKYILNKWRYI